MLGLKFFISVFLGLAINVNISAQNVSEKSTCLNLIFIGNSITQGVLLENPRRDAPPVQTAIYLKKELPNSIIRYSNNGISGCTTFDYLPETETLFSNMQKVADQFADESWAKLIFSIMLGTNDSASEGTNGAPVSAKQYAENIKKIVNRLLALYPSCKIILHRPIWYSENTYNSARYLSDGLKRLEGYYPVLIKLIEDYSVRFPNQVFMGDIDGFDFFRSSFKSVMFPEKGNDGTFYLHPNKEGAKILGEFWGKSILKIL